MKRRLGFASLVWQLAAVGTLMSAHLGCQSTDEVRIDITGCEGETTGFTLLVRVEDSENSCVVDERCITIPPLAGMVGAAELESLLRSQPQPLFDLPADQVGEVTIAVSTSTTCELTAVLQACGFGNYEPGEVIEVELDCSTPDSFFCDEMTRCQ